MTSMFLAFDSAGVRDRVFSGERFASHKTEIEINPKPSIPFIETKKMFSTLSDLANRSSIYKRHEARNNSHNGNDAGQPVHPPHVPVDSSIGETLSNMTRRSTIHKTHAIHHQEMHHDSHAGEKHMSPSTAHHHDSVVETLTQMGGESSIYDRNSRRNTFLHQNA